MKRVEGSTYQWNDWVATKEYYADGPSLFVWRLDIPELLGGEWREFFTLREAKCYAEQRTAHYDAACAYEAAKP